MFTNFNNLAITVRCLFCFLFFFFTFGVAAGNSEEKTPKNSQDENSKMSFFSKSDYSESEDKLPDSLYLLKSNHETLSRSIEKTEAQVEKLTVILGKTKAAKIRLDSAKVELILPGINRNIMEFKKSWEKLKKEPLDSTQGFLNIVRSLDRNLWNIMRAIINIGEVQRTRRELGFGGRDMTDFHADISNKWEAIFYVVKDRNEDILGSDISDIGNLFALVLDAEGGQPKKEFQNLISAAEKQVNGLGEPLITQIFEKNKIDILKRYTEFNKMINKEIELQNAVLKQKRRDEDKVVKKISFVEKKETSGKLVITEGLIDTITYMLIGIIVMFISLKSFEKDIVLEIIKNRFK